MFLALLEKAFGTTTRNRVELLPLANMICFQIIVHRYSDHYDVLKI